MGQFTRTSVVVLVLLSARGTLLAQEPAGNAFSAGTFAGIELRNIGPAISPGRVADIAIDPTDANVWYVATASSGLWKTINRGLNWRPVFDAGGSYSLGCVTIDPKDQNVIWLGTGENQALRSVSFGDGVYKSTDAGQTWTRVGLEKSEHIAKIWIDPRDSDVVLVAAQGPLWAPGGDRGLFKTADGGKSWKPLLQVSENTGITDLQVDPRNPDVMYAASYQRRRNVGVLIGGGPESAIYKTEDAGANWTKLTNGIPEVDKGRIALGISPQKPDVIYALITAAQGKSGFFRSEDRGQNWTQQSGYNVVDPQYYGKLFPDPHKADRVYAVDVTIHVTDDGGKRMTPVAWRIHVDNHTIKFDPSDANHFLVGNDGGLYETHDGGQSFRHFDNLPTMQFYGIAADDALPFYNVYAGAQDNGTVGGPSRTLLRAGIRTADWGVFGGADGMQPRADQQDSDIVYTQSQAGALVRLNTHTGASGGARPRADGPLRWNWDAPLIISPHSHTQLYHLANRLFRSDDRGDTWTAASPDLTRQLDRNQREVMGRVWGNDAVTKNLFTTDYGVGTALAESPKIEGLLYVGTDDGLIQMSDDGGKNWSKTDQFQGVPELTLVSCICASNHDSDVAYAAFNNYQRGDFKPYLMRTADRGKTWTSIAGNLPERHFVWSIVEDSVNKDLLFAGTEFGLFVTIDGGKQWAKLTGGVPAATAFRDLCIQPRQNDLVCASFGRGVFILDDITFLRNLTPPMLEGDGMLLAARKAPLFYESGYSRAGAAEYAAPNPPFGAILTYYLREDAVKRDATYAISIKEPDGKEVRNLQLTAAPGFHRIAWDLRGPAPAGRGAGQPQEEREPANAEERAEREAEERAEQEQAADAEQELQQQPAQQQPGRGARGGRGGRGGFGRGGATGPLVRSGTFKAVLTKTVNGQTTQLGEPQNIEVVPLDMGVPKSK